MFDWIRGDKYRIKSKEWFEKECIKEDGFYIHYEHQLQRLPQEAVDKYAGKVLEIQSIVGQYGAFVMSDEDGVVTKSDDGRYIAWDTIFFDELMDRDWITRDMMLELKRCALDRNYFYETYYKPVKIDKALISHDTGR